MGWIPDPILSAPVPVCAVPPEVEAAPSQQLVLAPVPSCTELTSQGHRGVNLTRLCEPTRCRGVTRSGLACRWTAACQDPVAAPLREGGRFCFWHFPRRKVAAEDRRQKSLEMFFPGTKADHADVAANAASSSLPSPQPSSQGPSSQQSQQSDDADEVPLTQQQRDLVSQKRLEALERRRQRQLQASLVQSDAAGPSQENATLSATLPKLGADRPPLTCKSNSMPFQPDADQSQSPSKSCISNEISCTPSICQPKGSPWPARIELPLRPSPASSSQSLSAPTISTDADLLPPPQLTAAQLQRIAQKRWEALERRRQREEQSAELCACEAPLAPRKPGALRGPATPQQQSSAAAEDGSEASASCRSRTPPRRRRMLMAHVTASPPPPPPRSVASWAQNPAQQQAPVACSVQKVR